jgi:predicted nicotinamide N-methyase
MASSTRSFVVRHTRLRSVPGLESVRLHLADDALTLWHAVQVETGDPDTPLPYWAFAWGGGLAIGRYLAEHPEAVADRRVADFAAGSGLCAIAAMQAGAASVAAIDVDPFAVAAIGLNARANGVRVTAVRRDLLDGEPPDADVLLAGDCWYEASLAERVLPWLERARERGIDVIVGDPGRRYLPLDDLVELARYEVRTTTDLEDMDRKEANVYRMREPGPPGTRSGRVDDGSQAHAPAAAVRTTG